MRANVSENATCPVCATATRSSPTAEIARVVPHKPYTGQKLDSLGYIFVAGSIGLASVSLTQLARKDGVLCEITRNDGH